MIKRLQGYQIILIVFFIAFGALLIWINNAYSSYKVVNSSDLSYEKAKVIKIEDAYLEEDADCNSGYRGTQELQLYIMTGTHKGETVTATNYLTKTHNILASQGKILIVCINETNVSYHVSVYNYSRSTSIYAIIFIFLALLVIVGDVKGLKSAISLVFTMICVLYFTLPLIFNGYSPIWISIVSIILIAVVTLVLVDGVTRKTFVAFFSTTCGGIGAGILYYIASKVLHISGFNMEEAETVLMITQRTGLQLRDLLFAGVLIAAVGAILDVAMSIASTLQEIYDQNPNLTAKQLYRSGINVGRDMIGTMSNTLILAYVGGSFGTIILIMAYSVNYYQVINMDSVVLEIIQAVAGSMGIILTVPIASYVGSKVICGGKLL